RKNFLHSPTSSRTLISRTWTPAKICPKRKNKMAAMETISRPMLETAPRTIERQTPSNVEAEQAVLGSILLDGEAITHIVSFLRATDFYLEKHRWIYEAIWDLHEHRDPIDFLSVT